MATVAGGKVVIFGAGGPVGAATITALKEHYTLRCTDAVALDQIVAEERRQSVTAPLPELLDAPHERTVVDVTSYDQVRAACEGMDAAINLTVLRHVLDKAFAVNTVGAYNVAKAAADAGLRRLIHTGPFHTRMGHHADHWLDHQVPDDVPLHPGDDLYALSKYLGGHITRVFAEERGLEVLTFLFCGFRPRQITPVKGGGVGPFTVSWEDSGESFLYGLRAGDMPSPYEVFFIAADTPDRKYRVDKARRLLGWQAKDTFEALYRRPAG
ncbi:MAG: NAD(P)-dependent oxidoreductase [bacterium]|nr:NAD(P)-dependent oxidoreductase [bacterium]